MWKSTTFALVFAVPVMTKGGCDGCDNSGTTPGPVDTGTEDTDTDTGTVDVCDSYVAQASDAEIAATPRARPELEQLAIELYPSFTADASVYQRLVDDLDGIGAIRPALAGVSYRSPFRGDQITVGLDADTKAAVVAGTYDAWDCANDAYEITDITPGGGEYAVLTFDGTYDVEALAEEYSHFPGVTYAEPNYRIGGGSTVCAVPNGSTMYYRIDVASGDCPAGCINHSWSYFTSDDAQELTYGGAWSNSMPANTRPSWMDTFASCGG